MILSIIQKIVTHILQKAFFKHALKRHDFVYYFSKSREKELQKEK